MQSGAKKRSKHPRSCQSLANKFGKCPFADALVKGLTMAPRSVTPCKLCMLVRTWAARIASSLFFTDRAQCSMTSKGLHFSCWSYVYDVLQLFMLKSMSRQRTGLCHHMRRHGNCQLRTNPEDHTNQRWFPNKNITSALVAFPSSQLHSFE